MPTILIFILSFILQVSTFSDNAGKLIPVFLAFSISYIPLSYLSGFFFNKADSAFKYNKIVMMIFIIVTLFPYIWQETFKGFAAFPFWVNPMFNFFFGIVYAVSPVDTYILGYNEVALYSIAVGQCFFYLTLTILIDYLMVHSFKGKDGKSQTVERNQLAEGQDVLTHQQFTRSNWDNSEYPIKSDSLVKVYGNGVAAVNNNSFCVKKGEVFALLGPNGAGKSTMFNVMTLDLKRSSGEVRVLNTELDNIDVSTQGFQMGMCPQFNTIWNCLSVDQSISFIGEIKGLSAEDIEF